MATPFVDYYKLLGLQANSTAADVNKAFRRVSLSCHPDKLPPHERAAGEAKFKQLGAARDTLINDALRAAYNVKWRNYYQGRQAAFDAEKRREAERKQAEVRRQAELRKQKEEAQRREALRKAMEARKQEEIRKQQEEERRQAERKAAQIRADTLARQLEQAAQKRMAAKPREFSKLAKEMMRLAMEAEATFQRDDQDDAINMPTYALRTLEEWFNAELEVLKADNRRHVAAELFRQDSKRAEETLKRQAAQREAEQERQAEKECQAEKERHAEKEQQAQKEREAHDKSTAQDRQEKKETQPGPATRKKLVPKGLKHRQAAAQAQTSDGSHPQASCWTTPSTFEERWSRAKPFPEDTKPQEPVKGHATQAPQMSTETFEQRWARAKPFPP